MSEDFRMGFDAGTRSCQHMMQLWIDELQQRLSAAEAELRLRTAEVASCKSACQGEMESADEYKAERDEALQRLAAAEEAARILFDDLSLFTQTEWLMERWPWLADEAAKGGRDGAE